ncbi:hypothetical protein [Aliidiomarina maris]|uniref:Transglycosylase SLT domain-containing protein n=1 Tax=Aliidiomarina maris TaxID=531312 RepID=A0A327X6D8_9GAMM|nr:hypothetical protein [Aliidiomarina maris]MCL5050890.1 hypothetical protein [Bacillota bacterium]RAK01748.1 hypothetical protein B0I24_101375 [Aliidiomarina maris]
MFKSLVVSEPRRGNKFKKLPENRRNFAIVSLVLVSTLFLSGCSTSPPKDPENICNIFEERRDWWRASKDMRDEWGVPVHVPMAMMYQESSFRARALPPRRYVLGFIPWGRVSDAYGYAQAKTMTWDDYIRETGNRRARRDNFADAIDFMGWFITKSQQINGVSKWDAYAQYLNYHEGWGGYQRRTYLQKQWLVDVSRRVDQRSNVYAQQLRSCEERLNRGWFRRLFFG